MQSLFRLITLALIAVAAYGTLGLSIEDFRIKDVCPKLLGIPACHVILSAFVILFFIQLGTMRKASLNGLFVGVWAVPFLFALVGSIMELMGHVVCPRTEAGTPMCWISLGMTTLILVMKGLDLKARR